MQENQQWYAEADATLRSSSNSNLCLDATRNAKEADVVMWVSSESRHSLRLVGHVDWCNTTNFGYSTFAFFAGMARL